jgi:hypothetical protein
VSAAAAGLWWAISLAHQHLFLHPFARGHMKAGPVNSPGEANVR